MNLIIVVLMDTYIEKGIDEALKYINELIQEEVNYMEKTKKKQKPIVKINENFPRQIFGLKK